MITNRWIGLAASLVTVSLLAACGSNNHSSSEPERNNGGEVITLPGGIAVPIGRPAEPAGDQRDARILSEYPVPAVQPEGVVYHPGTNAFYGGSTAGGSVYKARLDGTTEVFMPIGFDGAGKPTLRLSTQGFNVDDEDRLYIAGGAGGSVTVYQLPRGNHIATLLGTPGGYVNDMTIAPNGDIYYTDSLLPFVYRVSRAQLEANGLLPILPRTILAQSILLTPEIGYLNKLGDVNPFEANGIRATEDGRYIIIGDTNKHALYRLTALNDEPAPGTLIAGAGREIVQLDIDGDIGDADGITFLDSNTLYVMDNNGEAISRVELSSDYRSGRITKQARSERFHTPSGITLAPDDSLLVTSAELFDLSESANPFFVVRTPRF